MNTNFTGYRQLFILLLLKTLEVVATCSSYNQITNTFEHWNCPSHTNCCIYYGVQSCCAAKDPYMNTGYEEETEGTANESISDSISAFFEDNYNYAMVALSAVIAVGIVVLCCLQWRQQVEDEEEEAEMIRINQMIAQSEMMGLQTGSPVPGSRSSSPYSPQPNPSHLHHGEASSERTLIRAQQPPSYDSITKQEESPPPPYHP